MPSFLGTPFFAMPLMEVGDVFDLLAPLVLIPAYWSLFDFDPERRPGFGPTLLFLVLASLWGLGHGMHLAANSLGHLETGMGGSPIGRLTDFYDEHLSHYLWHVAIAGLAIAIVWRQSGNPLPPGGKWVPVLAAGVLYGFTYFVDVVESQTAPLGVPFAVLLSAYGVLMARKRWATEPLLAFFSIGSLTSCVLFGAWAAYWGGLPEFSKVGIIR